MAQTVYEICISFMQGETKRNADKNDFLGCLFHVTPNLANPTNACVISLAVILFLSWFSLSSNDSTMNVISLFRKDSLSVPSDHNISHAECVEKSSQDRLISVVITCFSALQRLVLLLAIEYIVLASSEGDS